MKKLSQMKQRVKTLKKLELKSENQFKVGDFVRCKVSCESKYFITRHNVFLKIIDIGKLSSVEILYIDNSIDKKDKKDSMSGVGIISEKFLVDLRNFDKVSEKEMQVYMV